MNKDDYICPMPTKWSEVHTALVAVWKAEGQEPGEEPPVPLILAAWHETPSLMKHLRWIETVEWAERHGCSGLIQALAEEEKFRG